MKGEPVFEVSDYYDGPRAGIAAFNGRRHYFKSRNLDALEYKGDFESVDIFELTPADAPTQAKPILAKATFHVAPGQENTTQETIKKLLVTWEVIE